MKKNVLFLIGLALCFCLLSVCVSCGNTIGNTIDLSENEVPENSIRYTNFTFGNVIQDGKRAIFLNFVSDYTITKMEIAGALLDANGNTVDSFDTSIEFGTPSYNTEFVLLLENNTLKKVKSVSFTKIKAYTLEKVDSTVGKSENPTLRLIATANKETVESFYASGSTIAITNGEIKINLSKNKFDCGFRWDLSEVNLKENTKYLIKFEGLSVADIYNNNSIQLQIMWQDSSYPFLRYYHVNGKRFDIISNGEISNDYYQFLKSKAYDEYTMELVFTHDVENTKFKTLYFDFMGVENLLLIEKIYIYELTNE